MTARATFSLGLGPALVVGCALVACQGDAVDPCQDYRAYDNVIHDVAEWNAFVDSRCTVVEGHLTLLAGPADPASLPAVEEVLGGVAISLEPDRHVVLPYLRTIGGSLIVSLSGTQETVRLPALTSVGQSISVGGNAALRAIDLPVLASVGGGSIHVSSNPALEAIDLPSLGAAGVLHVTGNGALRSLTLQTLSTATYVSVADEPGLVTFAAPALREVGDGMYLVDLPALPAVDLPALEMVGTVPHAAGLSFSRLGATRISMPALRNVAGLLDLWGNAALGSLSVPALDAVGSLFVRFNPLLPECEVFALRDHLAATGGLQGAIIHGNDAAVTCGP